MDNVLHVFLLCMPMDSCDAKKKKNAAENLTHPLAQVKIFK